MQYMLMFHQPAGELEQRNDFVVDVPDLDAAHEWAERAACAASDGLEVRPVFTATAATAVPA